MKKTVAAVVALAAVLAGAGALVRGKSARNAQDEPPAVFPVVVDVRTLDAGEVTLTQRTSADVQAVREAVVASRLTAYVIALPLFEGARFRQGEVLARLDMSASGGARTGSLDAEVVAAASSERAEEDRLHRSRALYELQGVSREQLQSAEAALDAARARHAVAKENQRNAVVTAPFDGVVSQRLIQPGDLATPGRALLKIIDTRSGNRVLVWMPESLRPAALRVEGRKLALRPWPEAGPQGLRRYEARTSDAAIVPGSRIDVRAVVFESGDAVLIPRACLFNDDGAGATLLRLAGDAKVEEVHVAVAATGEEGAATLERALAGQRVACASVDILTRLAAGAPFRVQGAR